MADIVIDNRLSAIEGSVKEARDDIEEHDERLISHSDRILSIEHWRNGNGARGAEARLQCMEADVTELRECLGASKTEEAIERIASAAARSIVKGAREKDMTTVAKMKAFAPYFAAGLLAITTILQAIL